MIELIEESRAETDIDYSVVIRTMGTAGEKYQTLLDSIDKLAPKPKEIIVVLPEGYQLPPEKLGYERFIFSSRGMIAQKLTGLCTANSEYILFCDDDLQFDSDFVKKLYRPLRDGMASISSAPLLSLLPQKGLKGIVSAVLADAIPEVFHRDMYVKVLRSSGWSYNRFNVRSKNKYYYTESVPGACLLIRRKDMIDIRFEDELWAEKFGYAAIEDQIMLYKFIKCGYKAIIVSDAEYIHLDGKTSVASLDREPCYAGAFNHLVFWHRFIFSIERSFFLKIIDIFAFTYWKLAHKLFNRLKAILDPRKKILYEAFSEGLKDGYEYLNSKEYKLLNPIKQNT